MKTFLIIGALTGASLMAQDNFPFPAMPDIPAMPDFPFPAMPDNPLAPHSTTPVVLVDGFDLNGCPQAQNMVSVFGALPGLLQRDGANILFFDNCSWRGQPIETLGELLSNSITNFRDAMGAPQVDVVAYSMGGLIARAALSQNPRPPVRKLILIGTPNLGTGWGNLSVFNSQGQEMAPGSPFLRSLNAMSQSADMMAIAGLANGGEGDGLVGLWSAALNNIMPNGGDARTRVISACHGPQVSWCTGTQIAYVTNEGHPTYQMIRSFLDGTDQWRAIGLSPTQALAARNAPAPPLVVAPRATLPRAAPPRPAPPRKCGWINNVWICR
jgi:pimeloyl-ACP methyl ester carboxylesterase